LGARFVRVERFAGQSCHPDRLSGGGGVEGEQWGAKGGREGRERVEEGGGG